LIFFLSILASQTQSTESSPPCMNINMSDNFSLVEGEWKDFIFKRIEPEDYQIVLDHVVKYFLIDEPTCALLGWSIEFQKEMCTAVTTMMDDGLSFYAVDKKSREVRDQNFEP